MADAIKNLIRGSSYWKAFIFKCCNGWFVVVAMAFLASTDGIDWNVLTPTQKVRLVIFCLVAGGKFIDGLIDQTYSRLKDGQNAVEQPKP